ncbi:MAG: hypothetical protein H0U74_22850 [Bradymonadaceae bacterium]|nr:hypothetical protein [Lujinxingiaceae bacterium]
MLQRSIVRGLGLIGLIGAVGCNLYHDLDERIPALDVVANLTAVPAALTNEHNTSFSFGCNQQDCTFACSLDGETPHACTSPIRYNNLADGERLFEVRARAGGTTSQPASHAWTIDTVAPTTTLDETPKLRSRSAQARFGFGCDEASCTFRCRLDDTNERDCQSPQVHEGLADGDHSFSVRARDGAGNEGLPVSFAWNVDTSVLAPPQVTITDAPDSLSSQTSASFSFACDLDDCTFFCVLDSQPEEPCTSAKNFTDLSQGEHTFEVTAFNLGGAAGESASYTWWVDSIPPEIVLLQSPASVSYESDATFVIECSEEPCELDCALNGVWEPCEAVVEYTDLVLGDHRLDVRATDIVGNFTEIAFNWQITRLPMTTITAAPATLSRQTSANFSFGCDLGPCTFVCTLDGQPEQPCSSPWALSNLSQGGHIFSVGTLNVHGAAGEAVSHVWHVDSIAPVVMFSQTPTAFTALSNASFAFSCNESNCTFECALDGAAFSSCTSPRAFSNLTVGLHNFAVRASDPAGNLGAVTQFDWEIVASPVAILTAHPEAATNVLEASFAFECSQSNCTYECSLDGAAFSLCNSPVFFEELVDGTYLFVVRATNQSAVLGPQTSFSWTIDTTLPITSFTLAPAVTTTTTRAEFDFKCDKAACQFECALDGAAFAPCSSPTTLARQSLGAHSFQVRATDSIGNLGLPALHEWNIVATTWLSASSSTNNSCAVQSNNSIWCWGRNNSGQLARASTLNATTPFELGASQSWASIGSGTGHTCAVRSAGSAWCVGQNADGQLGNNGTGQSTSFVQVDAYSDWRTIAAGDGHTCARRANGTVWCWGRNSSGQLGEGTNSGTRRSPRQVGTASDWSQVEAGLNHNCGLRAGGQLWCWGQNNRGQLGTGSISTNHNTAQRVGTASDWAQVSAGHEHSCGVRQNGTLWCWGFGSPTPTQQGVLTTWRSAAAGRLHTCAIQTDDSAWCWGQNASGQLGDATTTTAAVPVAVLGDASWSAVFAGADHTCATRTDDTLWCWGSNVYGQLGDESTQQRLVPTAVLSQ